MSRKIISAFLFVFILSSCGSNNETIPTSTSIPTLQATSTFTPEPTATNTAIPTEEPFQYTSCLNPELMEEIKAGFTEKFGMTIDEYMKKIITAGKYDKSFAQLSFYNLTQAEYLFVGGAEISIDHLAGMSESDTAFCLYFVDDSDTSIVFPVILAFTQDGEWNLTTPIGDNTGDGSVGLSPFNSMVELRKWWESGENKLDIGDVVRITYHSFKGVETSDQVSNLGSNKIQKFENVAKLIKAMSNDYLQRIAGIDSPVSAVKQLDPTSNDVGLFVKSMALEQKNPLGE